MKGERRIIIGIDEVGRGPLAGPVTVGVVACEARMYTLLTRDTRLPRGGLDSKKLKAREREEYAEVLMAIAQSSKQSRASQDRLRETSQKFSYAITHVSNTVIDSKGISFAVRRAMVSCLKKVQKELQFEPSSVHILLDGSLYAPAEFTHQKTIIKGDEKEKIIAWASILAKVFRDALMTKADKKFPQYGFKTHKGYGTLAHRRAIATYGISSLHRNSFCKNVHCKNEI